MLIFFFEWIGDHRELHRLTHSFPTRRSSDLSLQLQTGWLDEIGAVPDIAPDEASLAVNPKYALITVAIERARAGIAVATAAAVPDPTLRAGFRRYNDDDSSAIVVGVSVPIPVFDRNRGAILEARQSLDRKSTRLNSSH